MRTEFGSTQYGVATSRSFYTPPLGDSAVVYDWVQLKREVETLRRWNGQLKAVLCIVTPLMVFFFLAAVWR